MSLLVSGALPPTAARALPTAPYDAFTINGNPGSYLLSNGEFSFDSSNATFRLSPYYTDGVDLSVSGTNGHWWQSFIRPPTGRSFALDTTYPTTRFPDAAHAGLDVGGDGRGCNQAGGWIVVHEFTRDPETQAITAFSATYSENCELTAPAVTGEWRWHSGVDYKAVTTNPTYLDFGQSPVGRDGISVPVTITGTGSVPVTLGASSFTGAGAGNFIVTADGCAAANLAYGDTCTVEITPHPMSSGFSQATLVIPDDTVATHRLVPLSLTGVITSSATIAPSLLSFGDVPVGQTSAPLTATVTSTGIDPISLGITTIGGLVPEAFAITSDTCTGATLAPSETCTITVVAQPTSSGTQQALLIVPFANIPGQLQATLAVNGQPDVIGMYYPVSPARTLDTRYGVGARRGQLGPGAVLHLQVTGRGGVPVTGVSAVV